MATPVAAPPVEPKTAEQRRATSVRAVPWAMFGSLALLAVFLLPARGAALRGDDEWTFELRGLLELTHASLWHQIWSDITIGVHNGRPQVLAKVSSDLVLYLFDGHPSAYRLFLVALTVVCAALMWVLIRRLGGSTALAALSVVVFAGAVQFRPYHDAMLGYYGATQFALGFFLGSLLAFLRSLRGGGWRWAVVTVLLFVCACAMQEYMYPLASVYLCLAFTERRGRAALLAALPMLAVGIAFMAVGYLGRTTFATAAEPEGYGVSSHFGPLLRSYVTQLFPPLPGSDRLFDQGFEGGYYPLGSSPTPAELFAAAWRGVAVFCAVLAFAWWTLRRGVQTLALPGLRARLVSIGAPMWLAAPILVASSGKYQVELTPGRGYVEVLIQVVGFTLVAAAALIGLLRLAARRSREALLLTALGAAGLAGLGAAVDGFNNLRVVALEQFPRQTTDLLETAASDGAFRAMPPRSSLLFSADDMNWLTGTWAFGDATGTAYLLRRSSRLYDVRPQADQTPLNCRPAKPVFPPRLCAPPEATSAWVRVRAQPGGGVVIVSRLPGRQTPASIRTAPVTSLYVYVKQSGQSPPSPPGLIGHLRSGRRWWSIGTRWQRVAATGDWAIYMAMFSPRAAPVAYSINYPLSQVNFLPPPPPEQQVRIFGVKHLLP